MNTQEVLDGVTQIAPWASKVTLPLSKTKTAIVDWNLQVDLQDFIDKTMGEFGYLPLKEIQSGYSKTVWYMEEDYSVSFVCPELSYRLGMFEIFQMLQTSLLVTDTLPYPFPTNPDLSIEPLSNFLNLEVQDKDACLLLRLGDTDEVKFVFDYATIDSIELLQAAAKEVHKLLVLVNLAASTFTMILPQGDLQHLTLQEVSDIYFYLRNAKEFSNE